MVGLSPVMRCSHVLALMGVAVLLLAPAGARADSMHVVESGETLSKIAKRSGCSVKQIQGANDLKGTTIYEGQTLIVPACDDSKKVAADYGLDEKESRSKKLKATVKGKKGQSVIRVSGTGGAPQTIASLPGQTYGLRYHPNGNLIAAIPQQGKLVKVSPAGQVTDLITGLGTPNDMRKYVKNGTVEAFELWDPAKLGELAARTSVALVSGQITGKEGETFTAGDMGEYTIGKDGVISLGKPTVFNKENIDKFNF